MEKHVIGITMGDPAGIGPEIVLRALKNERLYSVCKPLIIGSMGVLKKAEAIIQSGLRLNVVDSPDEGEYNYGTVDLISIGDMDNSRIKFGEVQAEAGAAAFKYIKTSAELAMSGKIKAVATAPINKESIRAAKIDFIGHTEMLAGLTGTIDPLTMFQVHDLRVFFLSRHVPLRKACDMATRERIIDYLVRCNKALDMLGLDRKRMAVSGLNPHSGEHGLFGDEEVTQIEPAVRKAGEMGIDVSGPVPADSVFHQALKGKYDAVLSLYHDQGHIATKMVDFEKTISLTIGLPFLRTSVDHGTAFDIAGKGTASSLSMEEAVILAARYGNNYKL